MFSRMIYLFRCFVCVLTVGATCFGLQACNAHPNGSESGVSSGNGRTVQLEIFGYNYTNRPIDQFTVNGQGGANIVLSSAGSGGSGGTCCVSYTPGQKDFSVEVRWTTHSCQYTQDTGTGEGTYDATYYFYKTVSVPVDISNAESPQNIEVHFYPDGSVQAGISQLMSLPRLKLSKDRQDRTPPPRCPNDKKPVE
jgi:hypothetical protein